MAPNARRSGNPSRRAVAAASPGRRPEQPGREDGPALAIYDVMLPGDTFDDLAEHIFQMLKKAAATSPGKPRHLYLDIEGHRNSAGGFDADALELQQNFLLGFLKPYFTRMSMPLVSVELPGPQSEDVPDTMLIQDGVPAETRGADLQSLADTFGQAVYDPETSSYVQPAARKRAAPKRHTSKGGTSKQDTDKQGVGDGLAP